MVSVIAKTGTQILRGEFEFAEQDFEGCRLVFQHYYNDDTLFEQVNPALTQIIDGAEKSFLWRDLILCQPELLGDHLDMTGASLNLDELRQAYNNGHIKAIEDVENGEVGRLSFSRGKMKNLSRQWLPLPICSLDATNSETRLNEKLVPMLWFEITESTLRYVVAVDTDVLEHVSRAENYVIGNVSTMVDRMMADGWAPYLHELWVTGEEGGEGLQARIDDVSYTWDATYRLFVEWFKTRSGFAFKPYSVSGDKIDVNAYIDFGNDSTSVILREENHAEVGGQEFEQVKEIDLFDYRAPLSSQVGPFSTNIAFRRGRFINDSEGNFGEPKSLSIAALGAEATKLLDEEGLVNAADPRQIGSQSPKKFLWDNSLAENPWVFASEPRGALDVQVHKTGITTRMTANGTYIPKNQVPPAGVEINPVDRRFSRASLTTFVFHEIFDQIFRQINSPEFRGSHGRLSSTRVLKQVTVSCPTGMSKVEQIVLRQAAEEALSICGDNLKVFSTPVYSDQSRRPKIKPSSKELKIPNSDLDERQQWAYDEASVGQLVWLYSEIIHKRSVNVKLFKDDFGVEDKIRVASIDIGAGTADVMICDHELGSNEELVDVRPCPIFWDSMPLAGHDLLEKVVADLVIMGTPGQPGMLLSAMEEQNVANAKEKLIRIFGRNSARQNVNDRAKRSHLLQNLIIPIAKDILEQANGENDVEICVSSYLNEEYLNLASGLVQYVRIALGVELGTLSWSCPPQRVHSLVTELFQNQIATVSKIFCGAKADIVLLSGGVFKSDALEMLARKESGIPGCRLVNLNNYEVGTWYPWVNESGQLTHGKALVSIGSALADLAERSKLRGMSMKTDRLITAIQNDKLFISQKSSRGDVLPVMGGLDSTGSLKTAQLPVRLLSSPVASSMYPLRSAYRLDYHRSAIGANHQNVNDRIEQMNNGLPFEFRLTRAEDNREAIEIEDVISMNEEAGVDVSPNHFKVYFESLPNGDFWMERGLNFD